ncbi:NfeD family protein [Lachnobacterium bovis]|uniref:Membrane protein implicated in regulation of membrane protease activity n=1 Tax=Lachnobacterium bovis DSM 14045 TaxID=1122142 RepID=A0A1H3G603_9FIRM|nr:NfeD family protein [Lachnobacterium bovis]SDX98706.1 Membrane protein implicated in regulation of membrane protease activity [Lachnobacterium bovis DSM 14045]
MESLLSIFSNDVIFWLTLMMILIINEILTVGLVTIWFAIGAAVATLAAGLGAPIYVQIILFLAVSIVLLFYTKPFMDKYVVTRKVATNIDSIIGEKIEITQKVESYGKVGVGKLQGKEWSIIAENPKEEFEAGEICQVVKVQGVKLVVKKVDSDV